MDAVEVNTSGPPRNEENIISEMEICRICLLGNLVMRDLFLENEVASLSTKAMSFANVKMVLGDGLPSQVCCLCADKLESAYEFKLQVEQADGVLRERYDSLNIKEELFFNEVEVHLEADRNEHEVETMNVDAPYEVATEVLSSDVEDEKPTLLKDHLALLQVEKLAEKEQTLSQGNKGEVDMINETVEAAEQENEQSMEQVVEMLESVETIKTEYCNNISGISVGEHNYVVQQECDLVMEQEYTVQKTVRHDQDFAQYDLTASVEKDSTTENGQYSEDFSNAKLDVMSEQPHAQSETRKSKRKSARRAVVDHDSDEENYFENLNLSSRLKQQQARTDKTEKLFFVCYLCDKQFLSKGVLKEHMHSHEEVRRTLSLKKAPEKPKSTVATPVRTSPSGKKLNKCPHCGKEYLYIISFNKHLKQHEKKDATKEDDMSIEVSFEEDEDSLDFDHSESAKNSESSYKQTARKEKEERLDKTDGGEQERVKGRGRKKRQTEEYSCDKCAERFYTKRALRKHSAQHVPFRCSVCDMELDSLEKLRNHRLEHVIGGVLTEQDLQESATNGLQCEDDGKSEKKGEEEEQVEDEEAEDEEHQFTDDQDNRGRGKPRWSEQKDLKCPNCPMTYSHKKSLSRHLEAHSGTKYSCKTCCQHFTRKDHLRRHMEQHGRVKSFKCTQCNKIFGNELTLRNHLIATNHKTIIHGQEYDPNKRIKRVAAKAAQKIIDKIKTEGELEGDDDDDDNDDANDRDSRDDDYVDNERCERTIESLKRSISRKDYECATCNRKCTSKQSLTKHMEHHVKDEKSEKGEKSEKAKATAEKKDPPRGCIGTSAIGEDYDIDEDSDFEGGLYWPMDNHECPTCKKRYSTKKSLLRHQLLHEEPNFECDICNVKFYRKDKLKAHYDKCSEKNPDQVRKCNICCDSFENNEMLREHRARHVTEGILTEEDLREIEPRPEERKEGEKIARKRRTDIVGLECTECNKQYTSRKGLLRHIQVHEGKKYLCDICPKKFYRREHLKIHVAKHNMIKPYKCSRCTKRFAKEEQLTNHLSKHDRTFKKNKETDSSKRFLCEICSKSFTQSTTLIAHLRAHNGIKPYVCEVCSRPFTTNAYLKMHMRTHTQERPYICQFCSRAFARADTLANHLTSHTGEAKYHCKYCPKNFRRLKSLKEHVFIHTGQRPYACPTCDRRFNNNGSRYAHSKRCKQNLLQSQNRNQGLEQLQAQVQPRIHQNIGQAQIVKTQNVKTITIARPIEGATTQQVMQHQEILMPLILPLTVTLTDVGEEMILPEGTKIFTTS